MEALVCDICGGKLTLAAGGLAICDSCGTQHGKDRMQEKIQEVKGTVRVDNSHLVHNYLTIAEHACEGRNFEEVETYCNKIIEIEPTFYQAWLLKAKASGWNSSIGDNRFNEAALCFSKAIEFAPPEEKESIAQNAANEMKELSMALIPLRASMFGENITQQAANDLLNDIRAVYNVMEMFSLKCGVTFDNFIEEVAVIANKATVLAWEKMRKDYCGLDNRPDQYQWNTLIERIDCCNDLLEKVIELSNKDDKEDINCYENMIFFQEQAIDSCSWTYRYTDFGDFWDKDFQLTKSAKELRRNLIAEYQRKLNEIKCRVAETEAAEREAQIILEQEENARRVKEYWETHVEEKRELEEKKEQIATEIKKLEDQDQQLCENAEKMNLQERIDQLKKEKSSLGLFNIKERKAVQEEIDEIKTKLRLLLVDLEGKTEKVRNEMIHSHKELDHINIELTKNR